METLSEKNIWPAAARHTCSKENKKQFEYGIYNRTHARFSPTIAALEKKAHLYVQELAPSGQNEEEHSINGARLQQSCHQQRQQNDVRERRGEINNLRIHFRSSSSICA